MNDFTYHHTRIRSRSRSRSRDRTPLPRRNRLTLSRSSSSSSSDNGADDYPYAGPHLRRPSVSLRAREGPSRLERWGIWAAPQARQRHDSCGPGSGEEQDARPQRRERRVSFAGDVNVRAHASASAEEERAFRVRIAALSSRVRRVTPSPPPPRAPSPPLVPRQPLRRLRIRAESDDEGAVPRAWSSELFRRRERCVSEELEARGRVRGRDEERRRRERELEWWDDDDGFDRE